MLGPGLLYAGAAIGVSHIVQSTKAGAQYGWILIVGIALAHLFKYPFFELGPKYTATKGENILHGYAKLGKWALAIVMILTVSTMFTIQAAVTIVTAGLALKITGISMAPWMMSLLLLVICLLILNLGKYSLLDNLMKVIMIVLAITTIIAFSASFFSEVTVSADFKPVFSLKNHTDVIFLIAFLGWMPAPLDISIWHSIWSEESNKNKGENASVKNSLFDFKVGFWGTAILAVCFLMLGANVIYGTDMKLSDSGVVYAGQLIDIYVSSLGNWAYLIIAIAAFTTMFSTTLTCLDAMPRVVMETISVWRGSMPEKEKKRGKTLVMVAIAAGATIILALFITNMREMVNLATSVSFLTAPILAFLGILVVRKQLPAGFWTRGKTILAWLGFLFLVFFSIWYIMAAM